MTKQIQKSEIKHQSLTKNAEISWIKSFDSIRWGIHWGNRTRWESEGLQFEKS